jgi:pilus assembly protein TadC
MMPHDIFLLTLWLLMQKKLLIWERVIPLFVVSIYIAPYNFLSLVIQCFLIDFLIWQQQWWSFDDPLMRAIKSGIAVLFLSATHHAIFLMSVWLRSA